MGIFYFFTNCYTAIRTFRKKLHMFQNTTVAIMHESKKETKILDQSVLYKICHEISQFIYVTK